MRTDPDLLLDIRQPTAEQLLFAFLAIAVGLVAGMTAGIFLMSDLLTALS